MNNKVINAIEKQYLIELTYDGEIRVVEPHCYGLTTAGNEGLRAYQVDGYSSSGTMGWKMYDLSKANSITILKDRFDSPRSGYRKGDRGMSRIFSEL